MIAGTVEFDLGDNSNNDDDYLEFLLLVGWRISQKKREKKEECVGLISVGESSKGSTTTLFRRSACQILNLTLNI